MLPTPITNADHCPTADLDVDFLIPLAAARLRAGKEIALATLIRTSGSAPRQSGAQFIVDEDGGYAGYVSGGCVEAALAAECLKAMENDLAQITTYGIGSPYFDIVLPCGGSSDIHITPVRDANCIYEIERLHNSRHPCVLKVPLETGQLSVEPYEAGRQDTIGTFGLESDCYLKTYLPNPKVLIDGKGPIAACLSTLLTASGWTVADLADTETQPDKMDPWTAVITLHHDHEKELDAINFALKSPAFFIGALGSTKTHAARCRHLESLGFIGESLKRIQGPVGLDIGAQNPNEIAISILAALVAAKSKRWV